MTDTNFHNHHTNSLGPAQHCETNPCCGEDFHVGLENPKKKLHQLGGDYPWNHYVSKAQDDGPNSHIPQIKLHLPKAGFNWGYKWLVESEKAIGL